MPEPSMPDRSDFPTSPAVGHPRHRQRPAATRRRPLRRIRARRTAAIMLGLGIVLAGVELLILLSYL